MSSETATTGTPGEPIGGRPFYPAIDEMRCRQCGKPAAGWNLYGAFCSDEHFVVSRGFAEWSDRMREFVAGRGPNPGAREVAGSFVAFTFTETGPVIVGKG